MIDTKRTKDGAQQDYDNGNLTPEWKQEIDDLCDSHDELERKLKIAEEALSFYADQESWLPKEVNGGELMSRADIFGGTVAFKALKQIRGE